MTEPKKILLAILQEAASKQFTLGKTQLVKLLYLTEVEYFRKCSQRLTDLRWMFHYYGPYAFELETILAENEFERQEIETQSGNKFQRFRVAEAASQYDHKLNTDAALSVKRVVGSWGNKPLEELLDFVYFETEPMQTVERRGEELDFSTIRKEASSQVVPLKASKDAIRKISDLRKKIAPTLEKLTEGTRTTRNEGNEYAEAMRAWDEDMLKEVDREALAKVKLNISKSKNDSAKERH